MTDISADDQLIWDIQIGEKLTCVKSVVMEDDGTEAFTAGRTYVVDSIHPIAEPSFVRLTNNQGESHKMAGEHIRKWFNLMRLK